jgi:tRNA(fMet)-specific endonuclease VapC
MRRYLLDTGSAGDFINDQGGIRARADHRKSLGDRIGICIPVLGELWAGIESSASKAKNMVLLLRDLPFFRIWPFDVRAAREFGRVAALLKQTGPPIQQIDVQIAAVAFSLGNCTVVSKDSDFKVVPGLDVEDWS